MRVSCAQLFGIVSMVITFLAFLVSIGCPFWVVSSSPESHYGLIAICTDECHWYFEEDFAVQKQLPDWFKATQGLMAVGLIADVLALCIALIAACCKCYSINPHRLTSWMLLLSFISTLIGIIVFCVSANKEWDVELNEGSGGNFAWSLWICVGSTGMAFVTSGIFGCASRDRPEDYY